MAEPNLIVKRHDTWPPVKATLQQQNPVTGAIEALNLTGALKVTIILKGPSSLVQGTCVITAATEGKLEYTWAVGDTAETGEYEVEFEIEWSATHIESVPNSGYQIVEIQPDLPNA